MAVHEVRARGASRQYVSGAIVLALLGATAAAFVLTEQQKLAPAPITGTRATKVFSPVCECPTDGAIVSFHLRRGESLTVRLLDEDERLVRTLVEDQPYDRGPVRLVWDGRADSGRFVPDGRYRPTVHLGREERTFVLPSLIRVETTPPEATLVEAEPPAISPDGDGVDDVLVVRYRLSERARPLLYVDGREAVVGRSRRLAGRLVWDGRVEGLPVGPGVHEIELAARDRAGNLGPRTPPQTVVLLPA
jgi:hypothetical protein